ncbi:MAG TPA: alpha/beta hydrolase [Polyangia bacterium]|nr:alpha/beta hydrolase [Polyangia bacterium]
MIREPAFRTTVSFDGSEIAYQVCGDGPAIVLANGLGGTFAAWHHLYEALGTGYRVLSWDYRGLFRSPPPQRRAFDMVTQARDLEAILAAERIERTLLAGWSMGVQVILEHYRRRPECAVGMLMVCGLACSPGEGRVPLALARQALRLLKQAAPVLGPIARASVQSRRIRPLLERLGVVGPTADPEVLQRVAADWNQLDFEALVETADALAHSDARDLLPAVRLPVLAVGGDRDFQTPIAMMREMARALPSARLVEVKGGTHYTPIEFPDLLADEVVGFLRELRWGQPARAPSSARFQSSASRM